VQPSSANQTVTWTSSNASAATVDSNGLVSAVAAGTATITATTSDGGYTAACAVTVVASNVTYTIANNQTTVSGYTGTGGEVVIPDTLGGYPVVGIAANAFKDNTTITSVSMPNTVTTIGDYAFYGCTGLTSINLSTELTSISTYAFKNCTALTTLSLPASLTSFVTNSVYYCSSLATIN
jgi:hypothetical protein